MTSQTVVRKRLQEGLAALNRGDLHRAGAICNALLATQPDLVAAHFLVGLVALEGQDRKTAFQAFSSVTRLEPTHAAAHAHLARLLMGEGLVQRADEALRAATAQNPSDPLVQDLVGTVYSMMGEYSSAQTWFERAVDSRPNNAAFALTSPTIMFTTAIPLLRRRCSVRSCASNPTHRRRIGHWPEPPRRPMTNTFASAPGRC